MLSSRMKRFWGHTMGSSKSRQQDVLTVQGIECGYGRLKVLHGVSLKVAAQGRVCLLGENGTGKSTLLKVLAGMVRASAGSVLLNSQPIDAFPPHSRCKLGARYVPQRDVVFEEMSVLDNLLLGSYLVPRAQRRGALEVAFTTFPALQSLVHRRAGNLSGGERQMVSVGRALIGEPKLLMLDEPSAGLSPRYVDVLYEGLHTANGLGVSILFAEQNVSKALAFAETAYMLDRGRIGLQGDAKELQADSDFRVRYVTGAFGSAAGGRANQSGHRDASDNETPGGS
jgi:branched-chain amino acid transport system ATP-binding protein